MAVKKSSARQVIFIRFSRKFLWLKLQFHVEHTLHRVGAIRFDLAEAQAAVHFHGLFHAGCDGIEANAIVADAAGLGEDLVRKHAAYAFSPELRTHVESLHLADIAFQFVQCTTSGQATIDFGQKQTAIWRRVAAGQSRQFLVEALETQAEAEGLRILEKEFASLRDLRWRCCQLYRWTPCLGTSTHRQASQHPGQAARRD